MRPRHPNHRELHTLPPVLRRTTVPELARRWVRRATGREVVRVRRLPGASSSAVHLLRLADDSAVVLRRWTWRGPLDEEPEMPQREVDALLMAREAGLPVPDVIAADVTGDEVGDGVPALLMSRVPGTATALPGVGRLAETAAAIHSVDATALPHDWFPWCVDALDGPPAAATDPALWEQALAARAEGPPTYSTALVHRDFHPGNVLWLRGAVSGIVDWSCGCRGPWESDVATCRGELRRLGGHDPADAFLAAYVAATGRTFHPWWDLNRMLEQDADYWTPAEVARGEPQLRQVLRAIG